MGGWVGPSS